MHQHRFAQSFLGHSLLAFSSWPLSQNPPERPVVFIGGVHGDEPEGVWLARQTLKWLTANTTKNVRPWLVVECLNPDGYNNKTRTNSQGTDLNRNFPSPDWTPEFKSDRYHPGERPASAPEVQGLVKLLKMVTPALIVHAHSWKPCLVMTGILDKRVELMSKTLQYEARTDIGYPTPGSLGSYGWQVLKIPVLCIEEREGCPEAESWARFETAIPFLFYTESELESQGY